MDGKGKRGLSVGLLAGALLATSGCIYIVEQAPVAAVAVQPPVATGAPVYQGQPVPPGPQMQPLRLGLGVSGGFLAAVDPYLDPGFMWCAQGTIWLNEMLGIELDIGRVTLADTYYGGDLTVTPIYVAAIISVPETGTLMWAGPNARWRAGVGVGVAACEHSLSGVTPDPVPIVSVQGGTEWLMPEGGRVFAIIDLLAGDVTSDPDAGRAWDLTSMVTFRIGVEFGL